MLEQITNSIISPFKEKHYAIAGSVLGGKPRYDVQHIYGRSHAAMS